jgi:hypothetical protein
MFAHELISITDGSIPLPLGDFACYTLADSFGKMKGSDGRCERRHHRRENIEYDKMWSKTDVGRPRAALALRGA